MKPRNYFFPFLLLALILGVSCSSGTPTDPGITPEDIQANPERLLTMGPNDVLENPGWDCERNFDTENLITYPGGYYQFNSDGDINIKIFNCNASKTKVEVTFAYDSYPYLGATVQGWQFYSHKYGTIFWGSNTTETSYGDVYLITTTDSFGLSVDESGTVPVMKGDFSRFVRYRYTYPDGTEIEGEFEWTIDIDGTEIL
ncbi:MAG TPA: hypothetical protein VGB30_05695 [bacterium]|jgi:hypothetical protein